MNCSECQQLFDAYLDDQLAGSLRLEFDAHRLRCGDCQQSLAMLETIGNVVANDRQVPELSDEFGNRVAWQIQHSRPVRRPSLHIAIAAGVLLQIAAVLVFAFMLRAQPAKSAHVNSMSTAVTASADEGDPQFQAVRKLIVDRIEDRIWDMHAAGTKLTADFVNMARYLNIVLPDDMARESVKMAGVNPWQGFWDSVVPAEEEEPESAAPPENIQSI